jgi:hypothetical protein
MKEREPLNFAWPLSCLPLVGGGQHLLGGGIFDRYSGDFSTGVDNNEIALQKEIFLKQEFVSERSGRRVQHAQTTLAKSFRGRIKPLILFARRDRSH